MWSMPKILASNKTKYKISKTRLHKLYIETKYFPGRRRLNIEGSQTK